MAADRLPDNKTERREYIGGRAKANNPASEPVWLGEFRKKERLAVKASLIEQPSARIEMRVVGPPRVELGTNGL